MPTIWAARARSGPAYELASRFAEHLDIPLRLYTVRTREAAIEEVAAGRAHIGAAGLSTGVALPPGVQFGPGYHRVREHLIYRGRGARPRSIREAARGQIEVAAGSPHQRTLEDLRLTQPDLVWVERADTDTEEIMAEVSRGTVQFTLASSTEFALNRAVHPELSAVLDLAPERAISWVIATPGHDASLLGRVNAFFSAARTEGLIAAVLDRYYGAGDAFDYLLSRNFMEHVTDAAAEVRRVVPAGRDAVRPRLAAAGRDGLPGIEMGPARRVIHGCARADADDRRVRRR